MNQHAESNNLILLDGTPLEPTDLSGKEPKRFGGWRRWMLGVTVLVTVYCALPSQAHAQFGDIFSKIFGTIQSDIGSSLKTVNQLTQATQKLYQTTMWPLAAINQVRGFVSNSISTFRNQMNQLFHTSYSSATLAAPQQFESILHSRLSTQIPSLQTSFTTTFGAIPTAGAASPQDRVMMDIDDSLGQENLKTTLIADQAQDSILQTADQMENQVAVSTPGSNPYITAQAQIANLRCQAYMQKMLAAELRQEAGRIAHDNVLVKRQSSSTAGITNLITGSLTAR
jgi:hypothetical protein